MATEGAGELSTLGRVRVILAFLDRRRGHGLFRAEMIAPVDGNVGSAGVVRVSSGVLTKEVTRAGGIRRSSRIVVNSLQGVVILLHYLTAATIYVGAQQTRPANFIVVANRAVRRVYKRGVRFTDLVTIYHLAVVRGCVVTLPLPIIQWRHSSRAILGVTEGSC